MIVNGTLDTFQSTTQFSTEVIPSTPPVTEVKKLWLQWLEAKVGRVTNKSIELAKGYTLPFIDELGSKPWTYENVSSAYLKTTQGKSKNFTCYSLTHLRNFEKWLRDAGKTTTNILSQFELRTPPPLKREMVTADEYRKAISVETPDSRWQTYAKYVLKGMWLTGMAAVDVSQLQWKHYDPTTGVIKSVRAKTKTPFIVPLPVDHDFRRELDRLYPDRMKTLGQWPSTNGNHYIQNELVHGSFDQLNKGLRSLLEKAGVRYFHFHDLRATFLQHAVAVADVAKVSQISGHADPKQLLAYVKGDVDALRTITEAVYARANFQ
jgi:integrase